MNGKTWQAVDLIVPDEAREAIEYGLMEAGALGTEVNEVADGLSISGYFETPADEVRIREALSEALRIYHLDPASITNVRTRNVEDRDWLTEWKKSWQPVQVGDFIIAPPWSEVSTSATDSIIICINPGMAFGTGTHETTRLCLKAIGKYFRGGSFLDVGTGTGILAIAAAKMFSDARIEGCDTDVEAVKIAEENALLNEVRERIDFRAGSVDEQTASADLVCANLTAPVIVDLLPLLLGVTCGRLVLSGILDTQAEMVETRLSELSATVHEVARDGEWIALVV